MRTLNEMRDGGVQRLKMTTVMEKRKSATMALKAFIHCGVILRENSVKIVLE
jgi:hypothetical protein